MMLLLSICMIGNPATCREERINLAFEQAGPMACMMQAQPMIAQWQQGHTQWYVQRWRCAATRQVQTDI